MLASVLMMGWVVSPMVSDLPEGWRLPTSAELQHPMLPESPAAFTSVIADLDDDGGDDTALLLKSMTSNAEALWVRMSGKEAPAWIRVNEISWGSDYANVGLVMRIDTAEPGVYACPEAEAVCQQELEGPARSLVLSSTGIEYFRLGSTSSLYFWDKAQRRFQQVALSD
ncbi:hypothetical protein SAMN05428982_2188 [Pseudoxanthomonas sp. CF385]|uniref:hypothetical protein n=1 Tax=Pseudoxanthomonas sp. CF385 TaxID=1881042 RepID=UPI00088AC4BE|nr:hypothetical protein [Pseudoxanthomonas sp. CF385]SDQ84886.1 hypothetical protein SAMN05428982_2188 [Pseudoxanthomonas sp. CF385]